jgi:hypothetical protein
VSTTSFKLRFDRLLLPATATRQAVCVQPIAKNIVNANGCSDGVFLEPSYDPVLREITFRQTPDNLPMSPQTYELTAYVAIADTDPGIRSFDGVPLDVPLHLYFTVPAGQTPTPSYDLPPTNDHWCTSPDPACDGGACPRSVSSILTGCAGSGCHTKNTTTAAEGMSLGDAAGILATALNQPAHETETGEAAGIAQPNSLRFGRAMPILDPGVPGESYLVYKLLANHNTPLVLPFPGSARNADAPEITRLRASVVVGMPMPPNNALSTATLLPASPNRPDKGEIEWLSEWLLQGAPITSPCASP